MPEGRGWACQTRKAWVGSVVGFEVRDVEARAASSKPGVRRA